jgi:hypothetical protein
MSKPRFSKSRSSKRTRNTNKAAKAQPTNKHLEGAIHDDLREAMQAMEGIDPTLFLLVDQYLARTYPEYPAFTLCSMRARMCAEIIRRMTGRTDVCVVAGRMFAPTGYEDYSIGWDPTLGEVREMHAWVMLGDVILDPSVRHLPEYAAHLGAPWCLPRLRYLCGRSRFLARLGHVYEQHAGATDYALNPCPDLKREAHAVAAAVIALLGGAANGDLLAG